MLANSCQFRESLRRRAEAWGIMEEWISGGRWCVPSRIIHPSYGSQFIVPFLLRPCIECLPLHTSVHIFLICLAADLFFSERIERYFEREHCEPKQFPARLSRDMTTHDDESRPTPIRETRYCPIHAIVKFGSQHACLSSANPFCVSIIHNPNIPGFLLHHVS